MSSKKRGVVLIALGHPYYGNYAHQLAVSIHHTDPEVKVSVLTDGKGISHLSDAHKSQFDKIIEIPFQCYTTESQPDYLKAKFFLHDLSPYDTTIFIDSDVIWFPRKKISDLFDQLAEVNFTMGNRGRIDIDKAHERFIHWIAPDKIKHHAIAEGAPLYNLASEIIYFTKLKELKKFFKIALAAYLNPDDGVRSFGHRIPDEYAFTVAMLKTGVQPHVTPFLPFYWEHFERKNLSPQEQYDRFYGLSIGGNTIDRKSISLYNNLANHYCRKAGYNGYFPAKDKRSFLPERRTI